MLQCPEANDQCSLFCPIFISEPVTRAASGTGTRRAIVNIF